MNRDIEIAKKTVKIEIQALKELSSSFKNSSQFTKAVSLLTKMKGKAIIVGVGKSFLIAQKTAASLSSLGTPSLSVSGSDLGHGGMGVIQKKQDVIIILSVSGESHELISILNFANRHGVPVIGVSCKSTSNLIQNSSVKCVLPKVIEAGKSLAPTSSSLVLLSWGDCLAIACMKRRGYSNKSFIEHHTEGSLSTSLVQVKDIMSKGKNIPIINANQNMKSAIAEMSKKGLGILCVKEKNKKISILTDGDLRRHSNNLYKKKILKVCSKNPNWISDTATALSAIEKMNSLKITSLLVTKNKEINKKIKNVIGILHLHHCLSRGIK